MPAAFESGADTTFVVLDAQERQGAGQLKSKLEAKSVVAIAEDWLLDLPLLRARDELVWDEPRARVQRSSSLTYGQLVLSESLEAPRLERPEERDEAARILLKSVLGLTPEALASSDPKSLAQRFGQRKLAEEEAIETAIARAALVDPNAASRLASALAEILAGKLSAGEAREVDWPSALLAALLPPEQSHLAEKLAPTHVALPSGRRARVNYRLGQAPWVESRLQDFFGMRSGPAILNGKLPLALHLLAPNQRAVQITTDLAGFWVRHYPQIRRELSRRYPRHKWPEDPLNSGEGER